MEIAEKEKMQEQLSKEIQSLDWDINYHEAKLSEAKIKMQIAEYTLKQLIANNYAE